MHSRRIAYQGDTITLFFGHEGVLYRSSFVMYDKKTNSKWNHSTGLAMKGPLVGRRLNTLPSRMMRWTDWKKLHPRTRVMKGPVKSRMFGSRSSYKGVWSVDMGLSVGMGESPRLYPFDLLEVHPVINDTVGYQRVVVVMDPSSHQTVAFSRRVGDQLLHFEVAKASSSVEPLMRDRETGSRWNRLSGRAIAGPLKGETLQSVVAVTWYKSRWRDIYPDGTVFSPGTEP